MGIINLLIGLLLKYNLGIINWKIGLYIAYTIGQIIKTGPINDHYLRFLTTPPKKKKKLHDCSGTGSIFVTLKMKMKIKNV